MTMKISVIVPIYKVEKYLDRCVASILAQNVSDMEVILVDDGSPDNCPTLCDEWARKDCRIKVVHRANGGLSEARNSGVDIAVGEYITFVDSDDYLLADTYAPLLPMLDSDHTLDMLEFMVRHDDISRNPVFLADRKYTSTRHYWTETRAWYHSYACNKIYKRSLFADVRFPKGRIFEDLFILPDVLSKAKCVATTSHGWYNYCDNNDGISKQINLPTLWQLLVAEVKAAVKMKTLPWGKNGRNLYYYMLCRCYDIVRLMLGIKI